MTTAIQINANRANAQQSTGPVTPEGKDRASQNATTHGLTAARIRAAEQVTFDQYLSDCIARFHPQGGVELGLARRWAEYQVRIDRGNTAEASLTNLHAAALIDENSSLTHEEALGLIFTNKHYCDQLRLLMRYQSQATRGADQTQKQLKQTIAARHEREELAASEAAAAEENAVKSAETKPAPQNGFVSQPSHKPVLTQQNARVQPAPIAPVTR